MSEEDARVGNAVTAPRDRGQLAVLAGDSGEQNDVRARRLQPIHERTGGLRLTDDVDVVELLQDQAVPLANEPVAGGR